jgi:hypothetical protein
MYPIAYFNGETEQMKELVKMLNKRAESVLKNKGV